MGDFEDMAARLDMASGYLDDSVLAQQVAAMEMVIATLLSISETNTSIGAEVTQLTALQRELGEAAGRMRVRKQRLSNLATHLRGGFPA